MRPIIYQRHYMSSIYEINARGKLSNRQYRPPKICIIKKNSERTVIIALTQRIIVRIGTHSLSSAKASLLRNNRYRELRENRQWLGNGLVPCRLTQEPRIYERHINCPLYHRQYAGKCLSSPKRKSDILAASLGRPERGNGGGFKVTVA